MPLYVWTNKTTGETREVYAEIKNADIPPPGEGWEKVVQPATVVRGNTWGRKGFLK